MGSDLVSHPVVSVTGAPGEAGRHELETDESGYENKALCHLDHLLPNHIFLLTEES